MMMVHMARDIMKRGSRGSKGALVLTLLGCTAGQAIRAAPASDFVVAESFADTGPGAVGLSGLGRGPEGSLWAVPERRRELYVLDPTARGFVGRSIALVGVPESADTEALVILPDGTFVFGTETHVERDADLVLFGRLSDGAVRIVDSVALPYGPWQLRAPANRGIEGACATATEVVVGVESALERDGARFAPVAVLDLASRRWSYHRLRLTSSSGKLSGLACSRVGDGLEIWAIERHYEVRRLVRAVLGPAEIIEPSEVVDLAALVPDGTNVEGVELGPDGSLWLLSDNDTAGVQGPARLFELRRRNQR
jgi:hypothetical protein